MKKKTDSAVNRRRFLKSSGKVAAAGAVLSQLPIESMVHAAVGDTVKKDQGLVTLESDKCTQK